jgi:hypothetical protein
VRNFRTIARYTYFQTHNAPTKKHERGFTTKKPRRDGRGFFFADI